MRSFLKGLQQAMDPATWSRGVRAAREGRVLVPELAHHGEAVDQVELQVLPARAGASQLVVLYLEEGEWDCDCQADACEHAAAAAIAYSHSQQGLGGGEGKRPLPPTPHVRPTAVVQYAFSRHNDRLCLMRLATLPDGTSSPVGLALKVRQLQEAGPQLLVEASDMAVEAALAGRALPAVLDEPVLGRILRALCDALHVTLDGRPVRVTPSRPRHVAQVSRRAGGEYVVQLCDDGSFDEAFANGAGREREALFPLDPLFLSLREQAQLRQGTAVGKNELPHLLDDVLPRLARQVPVVWRNVTEPMRSEVPATVQFVLDVSYSQSASDTPMPTLSVTFQLVYAPPLVARVQGGALVLCGNEIPRRRREDEERLLALVKRELAMQPHKRESARGEAGAALLMRVRSLAVRHHFLLHDRGQSLVAFRSRRPLQAALAGAPGDETIEFLCDGEEAGAPPMKVSARTLVQAYERGDSSLALLDGGFAPLPQRFLQAHFESLRAFVLAREANAGAAKQPGWLDAKLGELCSALDVPAPHAARAAAAVLARQQAAAAHSDALVGPASPGAAAVLAPTGIALRPYQSYGVQWLRERMQVGLGVVLADDMGLGKTLQTLLACDGLTLVVVPTSLLANWRAEAQRFCPGRTVHTYHGSARALPALSAGDLLLTSYGVLRVDADALAAVAWDTMVLDEAQTIKTPQSQVASSAFRVGQAARARVALSGTPVENRIDELWSLLHFCNPGLFGSLSDFVSRYSAQTPAQTPLGEAIKPFLLRRTKASVAPDLPEKSEVVLRCTLSDAERTVYDSLAMASRQQAARALGEGGNVLDALEALLRLRQAACHPALLPGHRDAQDSAKLEALLQSLQPAVGQGHRALVFSQWTQLLDLVEPSLREGGISFLRLDGKSKNRADIVDAFMQNDGPPVLLMSLKAGGVGLNLTAADHVFLLDPWWNPAAEDQAADRAHRIGQTRKVLVHRLIAADTVDEKLLLLQAHKRALAAHALSADGTLPPGQALGDTSLSREELAMLLA